MRAILIFCLTLFTLQLFAATDEEFSQQFELAQKKFQNKEYQQAEQIYLQLYQQDSEAPEILQNLGLTYFALNEKGKALTCFRKLVKVAPRNLEARKSIAFIQAQMTNKDFSHEKSFSEDLDIYFLQWLKLPEILILHFLSLLVCGIYTIRRLALRRKAKFQGEKYLFFSPPQIAVLVFVAIISFLAINKIIFNQESRATLIAANKISVKSGPSENAAELYELFEGFEVKIESTFKDWSQITYQDQYTGWIKTTNLWVH